MTRMLTSTGKLPFIVDLHSKKSVHMYLKSQFIGFSIKYNQHKSIFSTTLQIKCTELMPPFFMAYSDQTKLKYRFLTTVSGWNKKKCALVLSNQTLSLLSMLIRNMHVEIIEFRWIIKSNLYVALDLL